LIFSGTGFTPTLHPDQIPVDRVFTPDHTARNES